MIKKAAALAITLAFATPSFADEHESAYSGIWQDISQSTDFYVVHENGDSLVLIALPGIEATADTLRFSYMGEKEDLIMSRLSTDGSFDDIYGQLQLEFGSDNTGVITPICETCNAVPINIVRIF
jgi:hypothetical protein